MVFVVVCLGWVEMCVNVCGMDGCDAKMKVYLYTQYTKLNTSLYNILCNLSQGYTELQKSIDCKYDKIII